MTTSANPRGERLEPELFNDWRLAADELEEQLTKETAVASTLVGQESQSRQRRTEPGYGKFTYRIWQIRLPGSFDKTFL